MSYLDGFQIAQSSSTKSLIAKGGNFISSIIDNNNSPKINQHERAACVSSNQQLSQALENLQLGSPSQKDQHQTPISTPTTTRKSRRRSNLFIPSSKKDEKLKNSELGSGRSIPLKQGSYFQPLES